jgi:hypothetical protein
VCVARKELVGVGLILPVAGASVRAAEPVQKKGSIGATAKEAVPVVNYVMTSPRVLLMGKPIEGTDELAMIGAAENFPCADGILEIPTGTRAIAFVARARPPPRRSSRGVCWKHWGGKGHSGRCAGEKI